MAPVIILNAPQLAENIGAVARVMANFGLSRLRIVNPKNGWPDERASVLAAGADRVLDQAQIYPTLSAAIADCERAAAWAAARRTTTSAAAAPASSALASARAAAAEDTSA